MPKTNQELIQEITATTNLFWEELSKVYKIGNIPSIHFNNNKSNIAGFAYRWEKKVEFNLRFAEEQDFETTIMHELAHIVQYLVYPFAKQAHGPEFKSIMKTMGFSDRTYHSYNVKEAKSKKLEKLLLIDNISADEL